jgi:ArsR family transcriptional regulator
MKTKINKKLYQERAEILKALAHPSRLLIIDVLNQRGEVCVRDLVKLIGSDQSTVSKHLGILRQARIIDDRKEGKSSMYRLTRPCVISFFQCIEQVMKENLKEQRALMAS